MTQTIKKIDTKEAPAAIGPYSQAIRAGDFVFVSGQLPIDPKTGQLVEKTIQAQTKQVLKNLEAILKQEGLNFSHVVKCEVFLKDITDFKEMNILYTEAFSHPIKPARYALQVACLPMDALVEISCTAYAK